MKIGDKIKKYRTQAGLSAAELGMKVGFSHKDIGEYIRAYEAGKVKPSAYTREKLARALNVNERKMVDRGIESEEDIGFIFSELIEDDCFSVDTVLKYLEKYNSNGKKIVAVELDRIIELYELLESVRAEMMVLLKVFSALFVEEQRILGRKAAIYNEIYELTALTTRKICKSRSAIDDFLQSKGMMIL